LNGKVATSKRRPDSFGRFAVRADLGASRFGPVYLGHDSSTNRRVVIRTFELARDGEQSDLLDAFRTFCETTLEHSSLARPLAFGTEGELPFLVFSELAGTAMDVVMRQDGVRPVAEVVLRAGQLADAIDCAASAGIHHGLMAPCDVILDADRTGVAGFGLAQALMKARIPAAGVAPYSSPQRLAGAPPTLADDIYSLAAITLELFIGTPRDPDQETRKLRETPGVAERRRLPRPAPHETRMLTTLAGVDAGKLRAAFAAAFSEEPGDRPATAAEFVASVQDAFSIRRASDEQAPSVVAVAVVREERQEPPSDPVLDTMQMEKAAAEDEPISEPPSRKEHKAGEGRAARRRRARARRREKMAPSEPSVPQAHKRVEDEPRERAPRIAEVRPEPILDFAVELPADVAPGRALQRAQLPIARSIPEASLPKSIQPGSRIFLAAAVVAVSFSAGFGGGFVAGHFSRSSAEVLDASHQAPITPAGPTRAAAEDPQPAVPTTAQTIAPVSEAKGSSAEPIAAASPIPPAAPPVESGRILVRSMPAGAAVVLDGQKRGITPLALRELPFGAHTIEISHPGHGTRQQRVTLSERRPARSVDVELRPASVEASTISAASATGSLQVASRPAGAQVFVDESLIGTTPLLLSDVATGSRSLRVELPGYKMWTTSVQIKPSARVRVSARLEP
jgi:hypothetical protein